MSGALAAASALQHAELERLAFVPSNPQMEWVQKGTALFRDPGRSSSRGRVIVNVIPTDDQLTLAAAVRLVTSASKLGGDLTWRLALPYAGQPAEERPVGEETAWAGPLAAKGAPVREIILPLSFTEPRGGGRDLRRYLASGTTVIWSGECDEGPHVGPFLSSMSDWDSYELATMGWSSAATLAALGFDEWPNTVPLVAMTDPERVISAVVALAAASPGTCELLRSTRGTRCLWTLSNAATPQAWNLDEQRWGKGLLRQLRTFPSDLVRGVVLGTCLTPAPGLPADLEVNSGKGIDKESAVTTTIGEALERFSALAANGSLSRLRPDVSSIRHLSLADFHPWGDPYEEYLAAGSPPLPEVVAAVSGTGGTAAVPECLVPFPYLGNNGTRPTFNDTAGLACHTEPAEARIRAASELLERNSLYVHLLHEAQGRALSVSGLDLGSAGLAELAARAAPGAHERIWLIRYETWEHLFFIVHAFYRPLDGAYIARSSGSGFTMSSAVRAALLEVAQTREQKERGHPKRLGCGHAAWSTPEVVDRVSAYLDAQLPSTAVDGIEPAGAMRMPILEQVYRQLGSEMLIVELPVDIPGRTTVRVLGPRLVCNPYTSNSAGGRKLVRRSFPYDIPS
ncbi:MAG: YcaO-like family protein [Acidimicrobiales bacterium]